MSEQATSPAGVEAVPHEQPGRGGQPRSILVPALVVAAAASLPYLPTLQFGFVFDDHGQILANPRVQSWTYFPDYFMGDVWKGGLGFVGNYYRPAFLTWLLLNYTLFGAKPLGWHLSAVALHVAASLLVLLVARRLVSPFAATIAAVVFALHPVHVEAVAWISGVTEPLLAIWLLSSLLAYWRSQDAGGSGGAWTALSIAAFALALLSKETALILPLLLFSYVVVMRPAGVRLAVGARRGVAAALPYLLLGAAYLAVRAHALGGLGHPRNPVSLRTLVQTAPLLVFSYLKKLVWPVGLSAYDDTAYVHHMGPVNFLLPLLALLTLAAALVFWTRRGARLAGFAGVWLVLPILPVLNTSMFYRELMHDRYLYFPSVGFAILIAEALSRVRPLLIMALACLLGSLTISESIHWASDLRLAQRGVQVAPGSAAARHNLAVELNLAGREDLAQELLEENVARDPDYWVSLVALGRLHYRHADYAKAERCLERALGQNIEEGSAHYLLALTRIKLGRPDEAEGLLRQAIALKPRAAGYHYALAALLRERGDREGALAELRAAAQLDPTSSAGQEAEALEAEPTAR